MKRLAVTAALALAGAAFAQTDTGILALLGIDLIALGASVLVFGKAIQFAVEQIKGWWPGIPTPLLVVLPFVLGLGGALLLSSTVGITDPAFAGGGWIPFGIVAAIIAGGWYETQKKTALRSAGARVE